ncbi:sensor histidine kinase [Streptomyces sp. NPDC005808]|uniref:sensor histidine kinase n=1 Tax=Streptomyces sp. NPDC005808 TaxID=3364734 RepID=UPI0036ABA69F
MVLAPYPTSSHTAEGATDHDTSVTSPAAERGLVLRRRLSTGLTVIGDHDALRRAVGNLLSNAVRLAPPGTRITVSAGRTESWLWISVRDEGPGILDGDQARVFDRFWRAKANGGGRDRHAGLGLAIVRQIVESHAGRVRLFSRVGEGSTFVLWFPAPGAGHTNGGPPEEQPVQSARGAANGRTGHERSALNRRLQFPGVTSGAPTRPSPSWRTCPRTPDPTAA